MVSLFMAQIGGAQIEGLMSGTALSCGARLAERGSLLMGNGLLYGGNKREETPYRGFDMADLTSWFEPTPARFHFRGPEGQRARASSIADMIPIIGSDSVTARPPHRTVRAEFPHTAPTLGI